MSTNIRLATDTDWPQILSIYRYYWDKHFENMPEDYEKLLGYLKDSFDSRHDYFNYWVYDNGEGEIYGWQSCLQVFNSPLRRDFNGELSTYVSHDKQNGLVAARLGNYVVKETLPKSPIKVLWTFIDPSNLPSQKLAAAYGFIKVIEALANSKYRESVELWTKTFNKN